MAVPVISCRSIIVGESDSYAEFLVRLSAPSTQTVSVNYGTSSDGALGNVDYDHIYSAVLSFAPGETTKMVRIGLRDDAMIEGNESFYFNLFSPTNATVGTGSVTATIIDNDGARGTPVIDISDAVVDETSGEAVFVISLDRPSTSAVSVAYATVADTAGSGDFSAVSGAAAFAPGEMAKTVRIAITSDTLAEGVERFKLVLSNPVGATLLDPSGSASIGASDQPTVTTPIVSAENITADEGAGFAEFVVRLSAPSTQTVSVNYGTSSDGALGNVDYDHIYSAVLSFAPGETTKMVRIGLRDDATIEGNESFYLNLYSPSNSTVGTSLVTATIVDDDGTIADTTAPLLASTAPADNALNVAVGANLVLTFNEAVKAGTGAIEIHKVADGSLFKSITVTDTTQLTFSGSSATLNPNINLAAGTDYYVTLPAGAIKDLAGNNYAGLTSSTAFNFKTAADITAPLLASSSPTDNAINVAVGANLVLSFNEAVKAGAGAIEIHKVADGSLFKSITVTDTTQLTFSGSSATLNPNVNLAAGVDYYVTLPAGAIKDLAGNNYAGLTNSTALNFKTAADTTALPEITVSGTGANNILDGDTTPGTADGTNFGSVVQGAAAVLRTFTVKNDGGATLTLGAPALPSSFSIVAANPLVTSLAPGASDTFQVELTSAVAGTKSGHISIATNDSSENPFNFAVTGTVTSAPPLLLTGDALIAEAQTHSGEEYYWSQRPNGTYVIADYDNSLYGPGEYGGWDCAEFVSYCVYQVYGKQLGLAGGSNGDVNGLVDGYQNEASAPRWNEDADNPSLTQTISLQQAKNTAGAILIADGAGSEPGHVAISMGNGNVVHATAPYTNGNYYSDDGTAYPGVATSNLPPTMVDVGDVKTAPFNWSNTAYVAALVNDISYIIKGTTANDSLVGSYGGNDVLIGGLGQDTLTGSSGNDFFDFNALSELGLGATRDVITDFIGGQDKIDLSTIDSNVSLSGDQAFAFVSTFTGTAGQVRYSGGMVYFNTDADTVAEYEIQLTGTATLSVTDFVL